MTSSAQTTLQISWSLMLRRFVIMAIVIGVSLFATAGRLNWWEGWLYLLTVIVLTFVGRAMLMQRNPDLLTERITAADREDNKAWDKVLMPLLALIIPVVMVIVAGLDMRFSWSPAYALWLKVVAWGLLVAGILFSTWAMLVNRFFSATVRIQTDRGHTVITDGPYRIVRHPGYTGLIVSNMVTPLLLGSLWALIPAVALFVVTVIRTVLEDRTLQEELPGYRAYTQQTRFRLIPGIW